MRPRARGIALTLSLQVVAPWVNSQTARFLSLFFLGHLLGTLWSRYHPVGTRLGRQLVRKSVCFWVPLLSVRLLCRLDPSSFVGNHWRHPRYGPRLRAPPGGLGTYGGPGTFPLLLHSSSVEDRLAENLLERNSAVPDH